MRRGLKHGQKTAPAATPNPGFKPIPDEEGTETTKSDATYPTMLRNTASNRSPMRRGLKRKGNPATPVDPRLQTDPR